MGSFRSFIDLARNPASAIEAHETLRKELTLTEEVAAKADAAKAYLARADELKASFSEREAALVTAEAEQARAAGELEAKRLTNERTWNDQSASLEKREKSLADSLKQHESSVLALNAERKRMIDEHTRNLNVVDQKAQANAKIQAQNEAFRAQLEKQKIELDKYATRMKQAANF